MELNELMEKVELVSKIYARNFNIDRDDDWFILKIQEELGELMQNYLMMTNRGRKKNFTNDEIRKKFEEELADVVCQMLLVAKHHNVDLLSAINKKWLSRLERQK